MIDILKSKLTLTQSALWKTRKILQYVRGKGIWMEWKQKQFKQANLVQLEPNKLLKICDSDLLFNKKRVSLLVVHVKQYKIPSKNWGENYTNKLSAQPDNAESAKMDKFFVFILILNKGAICG